MIGLLALVSALVAAPDGEPPRPSARQLAWHEVEFYGFLHFGPNTFTDAEWGDGGESPAVFAPTAFDADQIVGALAAGGMRGVILTAKHHDGFCLWDSATTTHDVASSPWREGRGDVVREIADACARRGLRFGVYVSPWDRNHADYGRPAYVDAFRTQLRELLTGYGPVFEVWFDGANGGDGWYGGADERRTIDRGSYYGWPETVALVRELQPGACIFSDAGPDIRWVGNERGAAGDPCWATYTPRAREGESAPGPGTTHWQDGFHGHRDGTLWMPAEVDVSIRPGWFFHERENDRVRTVENLLDLYYGAVGQGASLLLNVPPDRRGRIHEIDAARLAELGTILDATFARDLAAGAVRTDERAGVRSTTTLELGEPTTFDVVSVRERIADGQRIDGWSLEARHDGRWRTLAHGHGIGARRLWRGPLVVADAVRLRVESASAPTAVAELSLHRQPALATIETDADDFLERTEVHFGCADPTAIVRYTLDGSEPDAEAPAAHGPVAIDRGATVRARAFVDGAPSCRVATRTLRRWTRDDLRDPIVFVRAPDPGLRWRAWNGPRVSVRPSPDRPADDEGVVDAVAIPFDRAREQVLVELDGVLAVPADGIYRFRLTSDDGAQLELHDETIVDHDGLHGATSRDGVVGLAAGFHRIRVSWFNASGAAALTLEWLGPGVQGAVPPEALAH